MRCTRISVHFDACADSVYQALYSPFLFLEGLGTRLLLTLTVARVRLLGPWSCRVGIGLLSGGGTSVAEE